MEEKKGYAKNQVDAYIQLIQEGFKELEDQKYALQEEKNVLDSVVGKLNQELERLQLQEMEASNIQMNHEFAQQQLKEENSRLSEKMAELKEENLSLKQKQKMLIEEQAQKTSVRQEEVKEKSEPEQLSELFMRAKAQADSYIQEVKLRMEKEEKKIALEREEILAKARREADTIVEQARQVKVDELEGKIEEIKKEKEKNAQDYKYMIEEAKMELDTAKKEADGIIVQAKLKEELARRKEEQIIKRAEEKAERILQEVTAEYEEIRAQLAVSAQRFTEIYQCMESTLPNEK